MENWIKQIRERFSGLENVEQPETSRERRIPAHKTVSFKGGGTQESGKPQNWFRRQFSRQMSQDNDSIEEQAVSAAAAAFVIGSLEGSTIPKQKQASKGPEHSLTPVKSKKKTMKGEGSMRSLDSAEGKVPGTAVADETTIKASGPAPSIKNTPTLPEKVPTPSSKRIPTFNEKPLPVPTSAKEQVKNDQKLEAGKPKTAGDTTKNEKASQTPDQPFTTRPSLAPIKTRTPSRPAHEHTNADAWQKAEFAKIKKRYEELIATILSWENKKKEKARHRLDKLESEVDRIKRRAVENFHSEMDAINKVAGGARAKAAERRRKEEFKAKEKANIIRETGKIPKKCFCF